MLRVKNLWASVALASLLAIPTAVAGKKTDRTITGSVTAHASSAALSTSGKNGSKRDIAPASGTLKRALKAVSNRDVKSAVLARAQLKAGSIERKVLDWAIAMNGKGVDAATLNQISHQLAHWPGNSTMRENVERAIVEELDGPALRAAFSAVTPKSEEAAIKVAISNLQAGDKKSAKRVIAPVWRNSILSKKSERKILKKLGKVLGRGDHRARVEYLLTRDRIKGAQRIAGLAGVKSIVAARAAVERKQDSAKSLLSKVPASQKSDPGYLFAKARLLRQNNKLQDAAKALLSAAPQDLHENGADLFWIEQRILISDLLEANSLKTAYKLAASNVAQSPAKQIDSEFLAGWIALRKLKDTKTAQFHFTRATKLAGTPLSESRGRYWLARALAQAGNEGEAKNQYAAAAKYDTTFYGQLAAQKLGRTQLRISKARPTRTDRARFTQYELVQALAKLESAGQGNKARVFYRHLAKHFTKPGELALLAARAEKQGDYQLSLQVGKTAFSRGFDVDTLAWPIGAIPTDTKTSGAGLPLAYAIARQESTFQVDARSPADALGLLQLLPSTAKATARSIGVAYSRNRLVTDASYNARLGTAFLKKQIDRFNGSLVLTFAAYNAGPSRADDWVQRFGDPRGKSTEFVVDWIEQIPFSETRNYVQRVMENYQVYKSRLNGDSLTIEADLRRG